MKELVPTGKLRFGVAFAPKMSALFVIKVEVGCSSGAGKRHIERPVQRSFEVHGPRAGPRRIRARIANLAMETEPVSYTHLTLPTILRV